MSYKPTKTVLTVSQSIIRCTIYKLSPLLYDSTLSCSHRVCKLLPFVVVGKCSVVNVAGNNKLLIATTEPHIKFQ